MKYYAYMLKSKDKNKLTYVGWTNNLKKRLKAHNEGKGAKTTRGKKWRIIYYEVFNNKQKAMQREYYIKKDRKFRQKIKEIFLD